MESLDIKSVFEELTTVYHNLKAEVLATEVNKNLEEKVDFLIQNKSSFSRPYRRDVIGINTTEEDNQLVLDLSRNGLYDTLPEALFHKESTSNKKISFSNRRKQFKEEEKSARAFFGPLENEFFFQRLNLEENERNLLNNYRNLNDDFLINFWNVDKNIPKEYQLKLIRLLPYSFVIAGDLELSRLSLERILNQKVLFKKKYQKISIDNFNHEKQLGVNFITESKNATVVQPSLEVTIGPLKNKDLSNFLNNNGMEKFLNSFYNYFISLELDVTTKLQTVNEEGFILNGGQESTIGFTTTI